MSEDESISRLRALGLNLYESRAYVALLNAKQLTAKGVGQSALIPQSRTYDTLESLTRKGFAQATPVSPVTYVPVPPEKVLTARYESEKKRIQERAAKLEEEAQRDLEALNDAYLTFIKDFPSSPGKNLAVQERIWVIKDRENIENNLVELIKEAESKVLRITKPPEPGSKEPFDPFYILGMENQNFVYSALKRGVKMRWLSLATEIPTFVGLEIAEPPERRYLEKDQDITEKFLLVDNHSVLLNLHDPMSPAYGSVALAMRSRAVSAIFLDHFERMWKQGRPLSEVLPRTKLMVEELCEELGKVGLSGTEVLLYRTLARTGAITFDVLTREMLKRKVQPQVTSAACDKLIRLGLVHRGSALRVLMVEHPERAKASMTTIGEKFGHGAEITTRRSRSGRNL